MCCSSSAVIPTRCAWMRLGGTRSAAGVQPGDRWRGVRRTRWAGGMRGRASRSRPNSPSRNGQTPAGAATKSARTTPTATRAQRMTLPTILRERQPGLEPIPAHPQKQRRLPHITPRPPHRRPHLILPRPSTPGGRIPAPSRHLPPGHLSQPISQTTTEILHRRSIVPPNACLMQRSHATPVGRSPEPNALRNEDRTGRSYQRRWSGWFVRTRSDGADPGSLPHAPQLKAGRGPKLGTGGSRCLIIS